MQTTDDINTTTDVIQNDLIHKKENIPIIADSTVSSNSESTTEEYEDSVISNISDCTSSNISFPVVNVSVENAPKSGEIIGLSNEQTNMNVIKENNKVKIIGPPENDNQCVIINPPIELVSQKSLVLPPILSGVPPEQQKHNVPASPWSQNYICGSLSPLSEILKTSDYDFGSLEKVEMQLRAAHLKSKQEWTIGELQPGFWTLLFMNNNLQMDIIFETAHTKKHGSITRINFKAIGVEKSFKKVIIKAFIRKYYHEKCIKFCPSVHEIPNFLNRISAEICFAKNVLMNFIHISCTSSIQFTEEGFVFDVGCVEKCVLVEVHVRLTYLNYIHPSSVTIKTIVGKIKNEYKISALCIGHKDCDFASKFIEAVGKYIKETEEL